MWYLWFIIGIFIGGILSFVFFSVYKWLSSFGILRIDHSNPEKDIYRIDIIDLDNASKKKYVLLKIDNDADLSQK